MLTNAHPRAGSVLKGRGALVCSMALTAAITVWGVRPAEGNPPDRLGSLEAKAEIEALAFRYADATDAIGRGDVEEGRQLAKSCFTDEAIFEGYLPLHEPNTPPDSFAIGPDAWTDAANGLRIVMGHTAWQHQIGNIQITLQGNTATMKSYLTAYLIFDGSSGDVDLTTGVYTDHLVHTAVGWRIVHRTLQVSSFLRLSASAPLPP